MRVMAVAARRSFLRSVYLTQNPFGAQNRLLRRCRRGGMIGKWLREPSGK